MLHISEILSHGQAAEANTHSGSGGFVHLTEDHGGFVDNARLGHFVIKVVTLTGTLANTGEYDLPKGSLRIRKSGSSGTHNGMRNIVKELGTENFARIRVGFKPEGEIKIPLIDLVLSKISDGDALNKTIDMAGRASADFAKGETLDNIMQKYNMSL